MGKLPAAPNKADLHLHPLGGQTDTLQDSLEQLTEWRRGGGSLRRSCISRHHHSADTVWFNII